MHFTVLTFAALAAAAMAAPYGTQAQQNVEKRQEAAGQPTVSQASMTTADGSVVPFDAANVYLDSVAKGL